MTKAELYIQTAKEIAAVLDGETNNVARMATVSCLLSEAFESYFWTGFYVVDLTKTEELASKRKIHNLKMRVQMLEQFALVLAEECALSEHTKHRMKRHSRS